MTDIRVQRLRRRISDAVTDIDTMKEELADIRAMCSELSAVMRQIREHSSLPGSVGQRDVADSEAASGKKSPHLRRVI